MTYEQLAAKAPTIEGFRLLQADEVAQPGDLYVYMYPTELQAQGPAEFGVSAMSHVDGLGFISLGRSWNDSRAAYKNDNSDPFMGLIYRPSP